MADELEGQSSGVGVGAGAGDTSGGAGTSTGATSADGAQREPGMTLTREQLQEIVAGAVKPIADRVPAQQVPPLSKEELDKMLNVFRVAPEHVSKLGLQAETAASALQEIIDAAVRQAVTMSAYQLEAARREWQQGMAPLHEFARRGVEERYRAEFMSKYPEFKGFEPVLEMVYQTMLNEGKRFDDKESAFEAVAKRARETLAKLPKGDGAAAGAGTTSRGGRRQMSTVSTGGHGGGEGSGGGAEQSTARWLFGPSKK